MTIMLMESSHNSLLSLLPTIDHIHTTVQASTPTTKRENEIHTTIFTVPTNAWRKAAMPFAPPSLWQQSLSSYNTFSSLNMMMMMMMMDDWLFTPRILVSSRRFLVGLSKGTGSEWIHSCLCWSRVWRPVSFLGTIHTIRADCGPLLYFLHWFADTVESLLSTVLGRSRSLPLRRRGTTAIKSADQFVQATDIHFRTNNNQAADWLPYNSSNHSWVSWAHY